MRPDRFTNAFNPCQFDAGAKIVSIYSKLQYKVIEPDKHGMALMLNLKTGYKEPWNACNNPQFLPVVSQPSLF